MRYQCANASGNITFFTVNLGERRSDLLVSQKTCIFMPAAKPNVSGAFGRVGIGNIKSRIKLILRGTSINFITNP